MLKLSFEKRLLFVATGFVLLFVLRLGYDYLPDNGAGDERRIQQSDSDFSFSRKNYASEKFSKDTVNGPATSGAFNQKYEKIGTVQSRSRAFDEDEQKVHALIKQYSAVIQYERKSGLAGARALQLGLGVAPARFEQMMGDIRTVGRLTGITIDKNDKTNEYMSLNAKKNSLEKTRDALKALKQNANTKIAELIELEKRILEIEGKIQELGVSLGEFDAENEFCTVKFSLYERPQQAGPGFLRRAMNAMTWSIKYYAAIMIFLFVGSLFVLLAIKILEKLQLIQIAPAAASKPDAGV